MEVTTPMNANETNFDFPPEMIDAVIEETMDPDRESEAENLFLERVTALPASSSLAMSVLETMMHRGPQTLVAGLILAMIIGINLERRRVAAEAERAVNKAA